MRLLRMKPEYIAWIKEGRKKATTRLKMKPPGLWELASGSRFKTKKSGIIIDIRSILSWTRANVTELEMRQILYAEGFLAGEASRELGKREPIFFSRITGKPIELYKLWDDFIKLLEKLNGRKIKRNEMCFTHWYVWHGVR